MFRESVDARSRLILQLQSSVEIAMSDKLYGEDHLSPSRPCPLSIEAGFGNVENGFLGMTRSVYRALLESAGGYVEGHLREYAISCIIGSVYDKLLHTIV